MWNKKLAEFAEYPPDKTQGFTQIIFRYQIRELMLLLV